MSKVFNKIKYIEIVSAVSSESAGLATRANIDEYLNITSKAISSYTNINDIKVILNINPGFPPVNMSNSIYIEFSKKIFATDISKALKIVNLVNKKMQSFVNGYKAEFLGKVNENCFKITLNVTGNGDFLPKYAGNLDIITSIASHLTKIFGKK